MRHLLSSKMTLLPPINAKSQRKNSRMKASVACSKMNKQKKLSIKSLMALLPRSQKSLQELSLLFNNVELKNFSQSKCTLSILSIIEKMLSLVISQVLARLLASLYLLLNTCVKTSSSALVKPKPSAWHQLVSLLSR